MGKLVDENGFILSNDQVGGSLYIMEVRAPLIAGSLMPGQFVHMRIPGMEGHLLRRPFSVYSCSRQEGSLQILYQEVGFGTAHMTSLCSGEAVELIGSVGTPWSPPVAARRALLVGGGVGAAPLFMLAEHLEAAGTAVDVVLGAATLDSLVCHERYRTLLEKDALRGHSVSCATDDGTFGHAGFCTALVEQALADAAYDYLAVCGPEPMMRIVVGLAKAKGVPCEVSLERRMACGIGACLSCVVETTAGMRRACVDGPVFDAGEVVFS